MSTAASAALPGFGAPAVGFDTPFDMLKACHERVLRTLALQARLIDHLSTHGCDASARSAAQDVLRYFDLAAPLHHEDEELHVFPALAALSAQSDAALIAAVQQLSAEHAEMEARWSQARQVLQAIASGAVDGREGPSPLASDQRAVLEAFAAGYAPHIALEERLVYPAAMARMSAAAVAAMGQDMRRRRGAAE